MGRIWKAIYLIAGVACLLSGYHSLTPDSNHTSDPGWFLGTAAFSVGCLFPIAVMAYARHRGVKKFYRPSMDRQPLGWWNDTLQPIRVTLVFSFLGFAGACFALPHTDKAGAAMAWYYGGAALGSFIGERLVYRLFAKSISDRSVPAPAE